MTITRPLFPPTKKPLKIAFIVNGRAHESGVTTFINTLASGLRNNGHAIDVITLFGTARFRQIRLSFVKKSDEFLKNQDLVTFLAYIASKIIIGYRLFRRHLKIHLDLIYGFDMSTANVALMLQNLAKFKVVHFVLGEVHKELVDQGKIKKGGFVQKFLQSEEKKAIEKAATNMIGNWERVPYIKKITNAPSKIMFFKTPIDIDQIFPCQSHEEKERACAIFGLPTNKKILLYVGRLAPRKGVRLAMEAFSLLVPKNSDVHFVLAGIGPERVWLDEYAKINGLSKNVEFLGSIDHKKIGNLYRAADVFVFPSYKKDGIPEPFSHTTLEAMATSLPVVAFDTAFSDQEKIMRHMHNAYLVKEADTLALSDAINNILHDKKLHGVLANGGHDEIIKNGWDVTAVSQFFSAINRNLVT